MGISSGPLSPPLNPFPLARQGGRTHDADKVFRVGQVGIRMQAAKVLYMPTSVSTVQSSGGGGLCWHAAHREWRAVAQGLRVCTQRLHKHALSVHPGHCGVGARGA